MFYLLLGLHYNRDFYVAEIRQLVYLFDIVVSHTNSDVLRCPG